jgi:transposase
MSTNVRISSLVPPGLVVEGVAWLDGAMVLSVRASAHESTCPLCVTPSRRVHSRYVRQASDLPCSGRSVRLHVITRRFVCAAPLCRRRIFAERFDPAVLVERARRTTRLDCVVHHLNAGPARPR